MERFALAFVINSFEFFKSHRKNLIISLANSGKKIAVITNLEGVDLSDTLSDRDNFQRTNLNNAVLTNMIASGSSFAGAQIEGADFSYAVLDSDDQKNLCKIAEGINPTTGISTKDSLECASQGETYKPAMPGR